MKTVMTVGDLRRALEGVDDALPVWVEAEAFNGDDLDTLYAAAVGASFARAGTGGFLSGPPVDYFSIDADGVPEWMCRECGRDNNKHRPYCGERDDSEGGGATAGGDTP